MRRSDRILVSVLDKIEPTLGAEIGVWKGVLSQVLLDRYPELLLHMVDPWAPGGNYAKIAPKDHETFRAAKQEALDRTAAFGWRAERSRRSIHELTSHGASLFIDDNCLDFAFIDACHLYEDVKQDVELWHPKVRTGGILCGHDYNGRMDRKGVWGVKRAVDEFAEANGYEVKSKSLVWWFAKK